MARSQDLTKPTSGGEVPVFSERKGCTQLNCPCGQVSPEPRGTGFEGGQMGEAGGVFGVEGSLGPLYSSVIQAAFLGFLWHDPVFCLPKIFSTQFQED